MNRGFKLLGLTGVPVLGVISAKLSLFRTEAVVAADQSTDSSDSSDSEGLNSKLKLKQVQIFFRHGARTPVRIMPNVEEATFDPRYIGQDFLATMFKYDLVYLDGKPVTEESVYDKHYKKVKLKGGCIGGMLTSYGQYQTYELGTKFKREYIHKHGLISGYDPETVYIRSTHFERTVQSLRCVMAGFFGAKNLKKLGNIKFPVSHSTEENLFPSPYVCPVLRVINHAAVIHGGDMEEFVEDRLKVEKALGIDSNNGDKKMNFIDARDTFMCRMVRKMNFIDARDTARDTFMCRMSHGLEVPVGAIEHWKTIKDNATKLMFYAVCGQLESERYVATRLSGGKMMDMVIGNIQGHLQGQIPTKVFLYSAHDTTLMTFLALLDIIDWEWPPFAADIRFELYEDDEGQHFVQVLYQDQPKVVRGCDTAMCPVKQFVEALKPYTIKQQEYTEICNSNILEEIAKEVLEREKGEVEDAEMKERSDVAAGL